MPNSIDQASRIAVLENQSHNHDIVLGDLKDSIDNLTDKISDLGIAMSGLKGFKGGVLFMSAGIGTLIAGTIEITRELFSKH